MADANIIVIGGNADDQDHDIPDNTNPAYRVHQGGTDYIAIATTNSAECVKLVSGGTGRVSIGTHDPYTNIDAAADNLVVGDGTGDEGITIVSGSGAGDYASIFFGDANSGNQGQLRYEQNNEVMSFCTNTSERMRIDLNGDVGIGMTSPDLKLVVHGDDSSGVVSVRNASNGRDTLKSENAAGNRTFNIGNDASGHGILLVRNSSGTTNTFITGSGNSYFNAGNVGIGETSPGIALVVHGDDSSGVVSVRNASDSRDTFKSENAAGTRTLNIANDASGNAQVFVRNSSGTITSFINGSGNSYFNGGSVGIGVVSPAHAIDVVGTAGLSTGTAWTNTSDSRVKQKVETIENALEKIEALRPVSFEYTQDYADCTDGIVAGQRYNSFIAQEYAEVFPDAVSVGPDLVKESPGEEPVVLLSDLKQFTPHDLNMYLVRAVQELSAQIKELKEGN